MIKTITRKELEKLQFAGHAVIIHPRKKMAIVDGWKYYKLAD